MNLGFVVAHFPDLTVLFSNTVLSFTFESFFCVLKLYKYSLVYFLVDSFSAYLLFRSHPERKIRERERVKVSL